MFPCKRVNLASDCADPVIKIAIEPKSKSDLEKMSNGLIKLAQEDPSFNFSRDEETNQTVIEGMGELHLDIIVDRLRREYKVRRCLAASYTPHQSAGCCCPNCQVQVVLVAHADIASRLQRSPVHNRGEVAAGKPALLILSAMACRHFAVLPAVHLEPPCATLCCNSYIGCAPGV